MPIQGTGDGGGLVGGSRKIKGFLWMVLAILVVVWLTSWMDTPDAIAIAALYMVGAGGLYSIGGQALIDGLAKWRQPVPGSTTTIETTTKKEEVKGRK